MTAEEKNAFLKAYGSVLNRTWTDQSYMSRVQTDPAGALKEAGLSIPPGVKISVQTQLPKLPSGKQGTIGDLLTQWESGVAKGHTTLYLPARPSLVESELSEEQLNAVAGGACSSSIISCCCCC